MPEAPDGLPLAHGKAVARAVRLTLGSAAIASGLFAYLYYRVPLQDAAFLPLLGLFAAGLFLVISSVGFLHRFKHAFPFLMSAVFLMWAFLVTGWIDYIYNSYYGLALADLTTRLSVAVLNVIGIHAVQSGYVVILPAASKVASIDVLPACSGVASSLIFLAAYALMLVDVGYRAPKKKILGLLAVGIPSLYLVSMFRVPFEILTGYFYGSIGLETIDWYLGAFVILSFVSIFWWLSLRWLVVRP